MIIDPDFPDHWKVRMLVGLLDGDEAAPVYVLRLWAHCQNRRKAEFDGLSSEALKALCRFPGHANKLESSLASSGFIRRSETVLHVLNWAEYNASLIASWENGGRGGRRKKPTGIPVGFQNDELQKPTGIPVGVPTGTRVEKSREEKKRVEKHPADVDTQKLIPPTLEAVRNYCKSRGNDVDPDRWFNHYTANGWMVGKTKMKDWQAAIRTWEGNANGIGTAHAHSNARSHSPAVEHNRVRHQSLLDQVERERQRGPSAEGSAGGGEGEMQSSGTGDGQAGF